VDEKIFCKGLRVSAAAESLVLGVAIIAPVLSGKCAYGNVFLFDRIRRETPIIEDGVS
jgi:hypothetical protein